MYNHNCHSYQYLINDNIFLVYLIAERFDVCVNIKDKLIDTGMIALIDAIKNYDLFVNSNFKEYAINIILSKMRNKYKELCFEKVKC